MFTLRRRDSMKLLNDAVDRLEEQKTIIKIAGITVAVRLLLSSC